MTKKTFFSKRVIWALHDYRSHPCSLSLCQNRPVCFQNTPHHATDNCYRNQSAKTLTYLDLSILLQLPFTELDIHDKCWVKEINEEHFTFIHKKAFLYLILILYFHFQVKLISVSFSVINQISIFVLVTALFGFTLRLCRTLKQIQQAKSYVHSSEKTKCFKCWISQNSAGCRLKFRTWKTHRKSCTLHTMTADQTHPESCVTHESFNVKIK